MEPELPHLTLLPSRLAQFVELFSLLWTEEGMLWDWAGYSRDGFELCVEMAVQLEESKCFWVGIAEHRPYWC